MEKYYNGDLTPENLISENNNGGIETEEEISEKEQEEYFKDFIKSVNPAGPNWKELLEVFKNKE